MDPLAHEYPSLSFYAFVANNPIIFVDPDGKRIVAMNGGAQRAVRGVLELYGEKADKLFRLDNTSSGVFETSDDFMDAGKFAKRAKRYGVAEDEIENAYKLYKAIAHKDDIEVSSIYPSEAFTSGSSEGGSKVGGKRSKVVNSNYSDLISDISNGQVTKEMSNKIFKTNEYKALKGRGYIKFNDYDFQNMTNPETPLGLILIDGSKTTARQNTDEITAVFSAIIKLDLP